MGGAIVEPTCAAQPRQRDACSPGTGGPDAGVDETPFDLPDEATLTLHGLMAPPPAGPAGDRVMLIACGALAAEIRALIVANGWRRMDLECLPAALHNRPDRIAEAVRARARAARARGYGAVMAVYGDCGTGGLLDAVCVEEGLTRVPGPHCFAFFDGAAAFERRAATIEAGAFHATDFLVRQFDALIWRGLGLDRHPELRDALFGHCDRMVHLAQTDDPATDAAARRAAALLGLRLERRLTGRGGLADALAGAAAWSRPKGAAHRPPTSAPG